MKILIATVTAGAGHVQAGAALEEAWKALRPRDAVKRVDVLEYTPAPFRRIYSQGYVKVIQHAPELYSPVPDLGYILGAPFCPGSRRDEGAMRAIVTEEQRRSRAKGGSPEGAGRFCAANCVARQLHTPGMRHPRSLSPHKIARPECSLNQGRVSMPALSGKVTTLVSCSKRLPCDENWPGSSRVGSSEWSRSMDPTRFFALIFFLRKLWGPFPDGKTGDRSSPPLSRILKLMPFGWNPAWITRSWPCPKQRHAFWHGAFRRSGSRPSGSRCLNVFVWHRIADKHEISWGFPQEKSCLF